MLCVELAWFRDRVSCQGTQGRTCLLIVVKLFIFIIWISLGLGNMVGFENLKVGSRVQTHKDGEIYQGTVRYKGGLVTRDGDWVGVELDDPGT